MPKGIVDGRDIREIRPEDIEGIAQAHFFAGIGGFPLGLGWGGLGPRFPIWTAGDPCQGNSNAGSVHKRRHEDVAIYFLGLVGANRPRFVLRENPSSERPDALWRWDSFRSRLESLGYSVITFRLRSCCVGGDHKGERMFLLAERGPTDGERLEGIDGSWFASGDVRRTGRDVSRGQGEDRLSPSRGYRNGDGIPDFLDGARLDEEKRDSEAISEAHSGARAVSRMPCDGESGETSSGLLNPGSRGNSLSNMSRQGRLAGRDTGKEERETVQDVREIFPPQAQQEKHDLRVGLPEGFRETECNETLGKPLYRSCPGNYPDRIARTRALGNAVDPRMIEWIARRIVGAIGVDSR